MADRVRGRLTRPIAWLAMLVALGVAACSAPATETGPDPSETFEVSYGGTERWLATLDPAEAGHQVRDWARLGLAAALRMNADQLLDEFYDGSVLRDSALDGLVEQPVEPGRALLHDGTLHLLVPADDPAPERTIGELLDQRRADAGADPARVQVHTYRIDARDRKVVLTGRPAEPTAQVRAENGWVQRRVDVPASRADFLARTDQLTRLETRGTEIWAQGWDWPDHSAVVTPADVAVLQRGYLPPFDTRPGFSLDPDPTATAADLQAVLPGLSPAIAEALSSGNYAGSGFASKEQLQVALGASLFDGQPPAPGLPVDRTELWGLFKQLNGRAPYSQALYLGGLAGTEVGMTLFYTDLVAKNWTSGVGAGVPAGLVPGFVPDDRAGTPPSLCPLPGAPDFEFGRLWFGQNDAAFRYGADGVSIGRQATRLFFKAASEGGEVEPGYQFGRGLRWWDRHYTAVADYEPQYRRLEQLMRWSGALEWLTLSNRSLPSAGASADPGLTFESWFAGHAELRERARPVFVRPPSATQEAVLTVPSRTFTDCGGLRIRGGVSLADAGVRFGELPRPDALPGGLSRAAPLHQARTSVDADGVGRITRADSGISHQLRRAPGTAEVVTSGPPSPAVRIGDARLVTDQGRAHGLRFRSDGQVIDAYPKIGNLPAGRTTASLTENGVQITMVSAQVARFKAFLGQLLADPARAPTAVPGFRYQYGDSSGIVYGLDGLWIRTGQRSETFVETLAAEVLGPGGESAQVAAGAPRTLSPADMAAREAAGEPVSSTRGTVLDSVPEGTPVYTDSPGLLTGGVPVTAPVVVISTRPKQQNTAGDGAGPGGGTPGSPGVLKDNLTPATSPPGAGSAGGDPLGGGPWWLIGFGTGGGTGSGDLVLVGDCSADDSSARSEECPQ